MAYHSALRADTNGHTLAVLVCSSYCAMDLVHRHGVTYLNINTEEDVTFRNGDGGHCPMVALLQINTWTLYINSCTVSRWIGLVG